jgi:2-polyprenyl-6-methoxyphenol hydroxylase-like FAD-dependent oxidoreductase
VGGGHHAGMGIRRKVLDHHVLEHARSHPNVEVCESEEVVDAVSPERALPEVVTRSGRYRARLIVGADGIRSLVRRKRGLEMAGPRRQRYGIRSHFTLASPCPDEVNVYVDPIGEFYTTPVGPSDLQVALLVEKEFMKPFGAGLQEEYDRRLKLQPGLHALLAEAKPISKIQATGPFDIWARCRVADRTLLVGDAGGYLDPITGEGISIGLQGAAWAAEVIDGCLRRDALDAASLMPYHAMVEHALRHYKVLTRLLLFVCRHRSLATIVARRLSHCPELYSELLAINCGVRTFWDVKPRHLLKFCLAF